MENFEFNPAKIKVKVEDAILFAKLLLSRKGVIKKEKKQIASEVGVTVSTLYDWEDGTSFPEKERLMRVAKAYEIDYEKLKKVFEISKESRRKDVDVRKSLNSKGNKGLIGNAMLGEGGSRGGLKKSRLL